MDNDTNFWEKVRKLLEGANGELGNLEQGRSTKQGEALENEKAKVKELISALERIL